MTGNPGFFNFLQRRIAAEVDRINRERPGGPVGWRLRRVITRGFWLTDREEFHIPHGRLVYNGHNGSGKSVLLAAAIPFSLDNDKSAYRLNTFKGDRSRSIRYFAVGSKDDIYHPGFYYEARTVYYMLEWEWFGEGAPPGLRERWAQGQPVRFLTTGVGLTAASAGGDTVDSWGFVITDGRRVGEDNFDVLDERGECLSFHSLRGLVKEGGEVRRESGKYRELVNQYLFGFPDTAQFDALLDTLLQVRSSKLGGELKPSHVCNILRQSLPDLASEKMETLARIIGNLDDTQRSLETLQEALAVGEQVHAAVEALHIAQADLHAFDYLQVHREFVQKQRQRDRIAADVAANEQALTDAERDGTGAGAELQAVAMEISNLQEVNSEILDSEAVLANRRAELVRQEQRVTGQCDAVATAKANLEATRRELRDLGVTFGQQQRQLITAAGELTGHAAAAGWREARSAAVVLDKAASAFALEGEGAQPAIDLMRLVTQGTERAALLDDVRKTAHEVARLREQHEAAQAEVNRQSLALTDAANQLQQEQRRLEGARGEAVQGLLDWREGCRECDPPTAPWADLMNQLDRQLQEFDKDELLEPLKQALAEQRKRLSDDVTGGDVRIAQLAEVYREVEAERARKGAQPEAQPARSEAVGSARQALQREGIAAVPLYEACDFRPNVPAAVQGSVEAFLERAGLLDALVVNAGRRPAALSVLRAAGLGDALLVPQATPAERPLHSHSLAAVLVPDAEAGPAVAETLAAIAWTDDVWSHGLLRGTTDSDAVAGYVGVGNRRRRRQEELAALTARLSAMNVEAAALRGEREALAQRLDRFDGEWERLRSHVAWAALKEAIRAHGTAQRAYDVVRQGLAGAQEKATLAHQAWRRQEANLREQLIPLGCDSSVDEDALLAMLSATRDAVSLLRHQVNHLWESLPHVQRQWQEKQDLEAVQYVAQEGESRKHAAEEAQRKALSEAYHSLAGWLNAEGSVAIRNRFQALLGTQAQLDRQVRECEGAAREAKGKLDTLGPHLQQLQQEAEQARLTVQYRFAEYQESVRAYPILSDFTGRESLDAGVWRAFAEARMAGGAWGAAAARKHWEEALQQQRRTLNNLLSGENAFVLGKHCHFTQPTDGLYYVRFFIEQSQYHPFELVERFRQEVAEHEERLSRGHIELMEGFVLRELADDIGALIRRAELWTKGINDVLADNTFAGMKFHIRWVPVSNNLPGSDIAAAHTLLLKDADLLTDDERERLLEAFKGEIDRVRQADREGNLKDSFVATMKEVLDYRNWFQFIIYRRVWDTQRERWSEQALTDATHAPGSGGEKALSLIVPLVAAVHARYQAAAPGAPRLIALDEAFAGIDAGNTREAYDFLVRLGFNWIMTSEKLLAVSEALPAAATYTLEAPKGTKDFFATPTLWDGIRPIEALLPDSLAQVAAAQQDES